MKITLELDYDEAMEAANFLRHAHVDAACDIADSIQSAIDNENERRAELHQESLMESGGIDDSTYRREMKDAGRGHLVR